MPIVEIRTLPPKRAEAMEELPDKIAQALSDALGWPAERFVAIVDLLEPAQAKSFGKYGTQLPEGLAIIHISAAHGKTREETEIITRTVAQASADGLEIPLEQVIVLFQELAEGCLFSRGHFLGS